MTGRCAAARSSSGSTTCWPASCSRPLRRSTSWMGPGRSTSWMGPGIPRAAWRGSATGHALPTRRSVRWPASWARIASWRRKSSGCVTWSSPASCSRASTLPANFCLLPTEGGCILQRDRGMPGHEESRDGMARYIIDGGIPLHGTVEAAASKNAVLPIMAATLLTDDECVLHNVPQITDVVVMGNLLRRLGAEVEGLGGKTLRICCRSVCETELAADLVGRMRASVVLIAPLLARLKRVKTAHPGGCVIGRRDIDTHLEALEALGARVRAVRGGYMIEADELRGTAIFFDEASVTATENTLMAAVRAPGTTVLKHAACEPHVVDLCTYLVKMGARIEGIGSNVIRVEGVDALHGAEHDVISDHVDVGTFAVAAAMTGGEITIRNVIPGTLEMTNLMLGRKRLALEA